MLVYLLRSNLSSYDLTNANPKTTMTIIDADEIWMVEYSGSQDCFHMEEVSTRIQDSMWNCINKDKRDWYTVGLFASMKEAADCITMLLKKQNRNK